MLVKGGTDVTKVYGKAWLDAIIYVMHTERLDTPE